MSPKNRPWTQAPATIAASAMPSAQLPAPSPAMAGPGQTPERPHPTPKRAAPPSVRAEIESYGYQLQHLLWHEPPLDAAHVFVTDRADLESAIYRLRPLLAPDGFLWISWPKRAARVPTDITEDVIREVALPTGLVDVKVCAVDDTWSGLAFKRRK